MAGPDINYHQAAEQYAKNPMNVATNPLAAKGYVAMATAPGKDMGFVQISPINGLQENGWKFHISTDPADHQRAWNIIAPHVIENGLHAKFAVGRTLDRMADETHDRKGRAITLYATDGADVGKVMTAINADLEKAGIRPGHTPNVDRKVPGSPYLSYRNDYDDQRRYLEAKSLMGLPQDKQYNPTGKPDPFRNLVMQSSVPSYQKSSVSNSRELLATQSPIHTNRGIYLPVDGLSSQDVDKLKSSLKQEGIGFNEKTSSLNGGMKVLALDQVGGAKFEKIQSENPIKLSSAGAAGHKIDKATGHAGTAARAASELAQGNTAGAAATVAADVGTGFVLKNVAKRIPVIGAVVTAAATLWSAGSQAAEGNYGKAAAELAAGAAEAGGNIVGFGAGDAAREAVRGAVVASAGEKYAPEKSGVRQLAETAYGLGKKAVDDSRYKSMTKENLAATLQKDEVLPDKVKLNGKDVPLSKALEDKNFRTEMLNNLESASAKGHDLGQQISMIKAYEEKLDPATPTSRKAPSHDVTPPVMSP